MKNKSNDWIDAVRQKVSSNEPSVPSDSWDAIEKALNASAPSNVVPLRRKVIRWAVAAAAVVIVLGTGLVLMVKNDESATKPPIDMSIARQNTTSNVNNGAVLASQDTEGESNSPAIARVQTQTSILKGYCSDNREKNSVPADIANPAEVVKEIVNVGEPNKVEENKQVLRKEEAKQSRKSLKEQIEENERLIAHMSAEPKKEKLGGGVNLFAAGNFASGMSGNTTGQVMYLANSIDGSFVPRVEPRHYSYKHKQPISVGLKYSKNLSHNLDLNVGLNYTLLRTDVMDDNSQREFTQKLQFVGIPLGVNWTFARYKRFSAYVGAEVEAERCVDARFDGESMTIKTIQWSAHGLAGARLALSDNLSLYAEPKISHYFTELPLKTVRDEHDVNFNLQVGLTFNY